MVGSEQFLQMACSEMREQKGIEKLLSQNIQKKQEPQNTDDRSVHLQNKFTNQILISKEIALPY